MQAGVPMILPLVFYMVRFDDGTLLGAHRGHGCAQRDPKLYREKWRADMMAKRTGGVTVTASVNISDQVV
jgi:hypothetical protein